MLVWNTFFIILLSSRCKLTVVAVPDDGLGLDHELNERRLVKRHDLDYATCLNSFDIHSDKIIRTQDSRAMGAKYINERDVSNREDCLRLCCETSECDVFVFEEKNPGSCYLFECGTSDDFKCKFTKHRNYTSAVLSSTRHMTELESQIKLTQHEHELTKLRKPDVIAIVMTQPPTTESTTTAPQGSKEVAPLIPTSTNTELEVQNRHCSRYQFECHTSGECIAIYNACDGIPQCSDGSDEAPELGCPAQVSTTSPIAKTNPAPADTAPIVSSTSHKLSPSLVQPSVNQQLPSTSIADDSQMTMPVLSKQFKSNQWTPQMYGVAMENQHASGNYLHNSAQQNVLPLTFNQQIDMQQTNPQTQDIQPPSQLVNQAKMYGREGEGLLYHPGGEVMQWSSYQQEQSPNTYQAINSGNSQIFSHKGSGLVSQTDSNNGQYEPLQNEYNRYNNYYENPSVYRGMQSQGQMQNKWPSMHKSHDANNLEENLSLAGPNMPQNMLPSPQGQDYYYEESFRTRVQPQMIPQRLASHTMPNTNIEIPKDKITVHHIEAEVASHEPAIVSHNEGSTVKKAEAQHPVTVNTTTAKPKEIKHHNSHRKMEQLTAELTLSESSFDTDIEQQNVSPRGAILSLTMGMCVTGIMLVLVGCRMRMVRRRLRRGSKSPYAHDADFLVNGMYL